MATTSLKANDSLIDDDFEVIQHNVDLSLAEPTAMDSAVLPPLLVPSSLSIVDSDSLSDYQKEDTLRQETAVLTTSILSNTSSSPTLNGVMASLDETSLQLESIKSAIRDLEVGVVGIRGEAANTLSERLNMASEDLEHMREELERARKAESEMSRKVVVLQEELVVEKHKAAEAIMREKEEALRQNFARCAEMVQLQQELLNERMQKEKAEADRTSLERQMSEMRNKPMVDESLVLVRSLGMDEQEKMKEERDAMAKEIETLRSELSVQCAEKLQMMEQHDYMKKQFESHIAYGGVPVDQEYNTNLTKQLVDERALTATLREKIAHLERDASVSKEESEDKGEIIKVMQEEHVEGTRILADYNRRIKDLEQTLTRYGADHGFP